MSEPRVPLWNSNNSDVLPEFRLSYGHALFGSLLPKDVPSRLIKCLGLGRPAYDGPLNEQAIPRHKGHRTFGVANEVHLLLAGMNGAYSIFGPHHLFLSSSKWTELNAKVGGPMAFVNQMDETGGFFYVIFERGQKQADAVVENQSIRVLADETISVYIGSEQVYRSRPKRTMSDATIIELIKRDSEVTICDGRIAIKPRFGDKGGVTAPLRHFIFYTSSEK